jgi:hypothetical protein
MGMSGASARLTAFERARIAYEQMAKRKRQAAAARRARERARSVRRAVASCAVITLLLGVTVYQGWHSALLGSPTPPRDSTGDRFASDRTGRVRTPVSGDTCRELEFDNANGRFTGGSIGPCDEVNESALAAAKAQPTRRLDSLRSVFARP